MSRNRRRKKHVVCEMVWLVFIWLAIIAKVLVDMSRCFQHLKDLIHFKAATPASLCVSACGLYLPRDREVK